MAQKEGAALRKRALIAKSNRTMFIFVACASVVMSASAVVVIMLFQRMDHMNRAISELQKTEKTLKESNTQVTALQDNIRALGSNERLQALRVNPTDNALQVVLDALPTEPNASALGASIQKVLLADNSVESLNISLEGDASATETAADTTTGEGATASSGQTSTVGTISVRFSVRGDEPVLKEVLTKLERSIRTIQVQKITIEGSSSTPLMNVEAVAYYQPSQSLQLQKKEIKP